LLDRFEGVHAQVLGVSVDSVPCLKAWADSLGGITYPLLSDFYPHGQVAQLYDVFRSEGHSERAIFVIDKRGLIRYVDVHAIDEQPDNDVLFNVLYELEPDARPLDQAAPAPEADIVLYCTPWCPGCSKARVYLKAHRLPFVEVDISKDRAAAQRVRAWARGFETTPTFDIKGTILVDFDRDKLDEVFGFKE
jgi:glutaredoxin